MAEEPKQQLIEALLATAWRELQEHPIVTISALVVIVTGLIAFTNKGRDIVKGMLHRLAFKILPQVPRKTVRIVPKSNERWWHMGSSNNEPAMQVVTSLHVTNITDEPVTILSAIIKPTDTQGMVFTQHPDENIYGEYPILPRRTTSVSVDFFIKPPIKEKGKNFRARIILVDQYGNRHKTPKITFLSDMKTHHKEEEQPPEEKLSAIIDPLEKQLVAILKDETNRYKGCGRRTGGLGSVQTRYNNQVYSGVPPGSRKADSPRQQSIVENPENTMIESDNLTAFLNILKKENSEEKKRFISSVLTKRLSRESEYSDIGYFFLLNFIALGQLKYVLYVAKRDLHGDNKHGFSDLLRMLSELLEFIHHDFSDDDLDMIEEFLDGIEEHTFSISERLVAIRAYRLSKT